ncbi:MAG: hypothetical protein KDA84_24195 [Planctomycetaceae bacterium]|nr:hypothetical protein [Planctomycetaceae bacterium]
MTQSLKVLYINSDGAGFADDLDVAPNATNRYAGSVTYPLTVMSRSISWPANLF